jgi:antibiotic biosynthesis monooxygenase (ABM) superfamily enzyme
MPPKKWKIAILVWLAIYPSVTLLSWLFGKQLNQITFLPLRTLVLTIVIVPLMVFVLLPLLQKVFAGWLRKK